MGSRTVWTAVIMFLINGVQGIHAMIPASLLPLVDAALTIAAAYFHLNPSQNYAPTEPEQQ